MAVTTTLLMRLEHGPLHSRKQGVYQACRGMQDFLDNKDFSNRMQAVLREVNHRSKTRLFPKLFGISLLWIPSNQITS